MDEQLPLFDSPLDLPNDEPLRKYGRKKRGGYVPKYGITDAIRQANETLDRIHAEFEGLKAYEGRCVGCGKVISTKAPHCNRRWCKAVWKTWSRDQRRVVREALKAASPIIILTDVTLPGVGPAGAGWVRGRRNYLPWADGPARVATPRSLYRANSRFKKRMRWVKRQAYNDGRAALRAAGFPTDRLPPVLVCVLELQKRGALHAHLALGYTTAAERVFARAYIDSLKKWAPRCGLGFVDGWQQAERKSVYANDRAASYLCKYLTKDHPPWFLRTLQRAGRDRLPAGDRPVNVHDGAPPKDTETVGRTRRTLRLPGMGLGNSHQGWSAARRTGRDGAGAVIAAAGGGDQARACAAARRADRARAKPQHPAS